MSKKIEVLLNALIENPYLHNRDTAFYELCRVVTRYEIESLFSATSPAKVNFGPFGDITFPYVKMGAIDSLDLFGLDELILFCFYRINKHRYTRVLDIGANLGLHSIIMSKMGFTVKAFEPDPWHYKLLAENVRVNKADSVELNLKAVSQSDGVAQFVRVLGNTTGSHLMGSKDSYGDKEVFEVETANVRPLFDWADLAKIDAEGHEKELLLTLTSEQMQSLDIIVEVGNKRNAEALFKHFSSIGINMFTQKSGWERISRLDEVPVSHREGSLFISHRAEMPWR